MTTSPVKLDVYISSFISKPRVLFYKGFPTVKHPQDFLTSPELSGWQEKKKVGALARFQA